MLRQTWVKGENAIEWLEKKIPSQTLSNKYAKWIRSEFVTNWLTECLHGNYDDHEHLILAIAVNEYPTIPLYHKFSKSSAGEIIDYYLFFNPKQGKYKTLDLFVVSADTSKMQRLTYFENIL